MIHCVALGDRRVAGLSEAIGCRSFYERLIPEFECSPTDSFQLLLLKDISRKLGSRRRPRDRQHFQAGVSSMGVNPERSRHCRACHRS